MKKMKLGEHSVVMFDSIEELPIVRFQKYNKMLMLDAGLGSDLTALDAHLARVGEFIKAGETDNAAREIDNLRQTLFNVQNGLTPHFMSLIPLMAEVDGEPLTDLSDENIQRVYDTLKDVTMKAYEGAASEVKKKIEEELKAYFNQGGESAASKEYYELMRRRALLMLDEIGDGRDRSEEIRAIESQMVRSDKPRVFQGERNAEVLYDKNFVGCCIAIAQNLNMDAKQMTVLEYYRAIEVLEEQQKELKRKR
ncbi:MAG: hypothetical protein J5526_08875 [Bacteroidales bacterium]|nr:hypothetical protein [Bacteroidales bacterium]